METEALSARENGLRQTWNPNPPSVGVILRGPMTFRPCKSLRVVDTTLLHFSTLTNGYRIQPRTRGSRDGFVKQKITSVQLEGPSARGIRDLPTLEWISWNPIYQYYNVNPMRKGGIMRE